MASMFDNDTSLRAAKMALDGLSMRQQAIGQNLANVDTPGYQASTVKFEDAIRSVFKKHTSLRMASTDPQHLSAAAQKTTTGAVSALRTGGSAREDGNNVDIDVELIDMTETGISYQALTQAASKKLLLLKNIAMAG